MRTYKRRKFFIDRKLQSKYILLTIVMLFLYTFALVIVMFVPYILPLELSTSPEERVSAARMLLSLHKSVWPAIGVVIIVTGILTIFVSHRVAGPVYRLKSVLGEISRGKLNLDVKLRKYDDLQDLASSVNLVIVEMRTLVQTLKNQNATLTSCIQELEEHMQTGTSGHSHDRDILEKLKGHRDNVSKTLDKYTIQ